MTIVKPTLSVYRTRFLHLLNSGEEQVAESGVRVLLRYPTSHSEDQSFEILDKGLVEDGYDFAKMTPVELLKFVGWYEENIRELVQFSEENLDGVTIGGDHFSWDDLVSQGYEFFSPSRAQRGTSRRG